MKPTISCLLVAVCFSTACASTGEDIAAADNHLESAPPPAAAPAPNPPSASTPQPPTASKPKPEACEAIGDDRDGCTARPDCEFFVRPVQGDDIGSVCVERDDSALALDCKGNEAKAQWKFSTAEASPDGKLHFSLIAGNGEQILGSEGFPDDKSREDAWLRLQTEGEDLSIYRLTKLPDRSVLFRIVSNQPDHLVLGLSDAYASKSNAVRGLKRVHQILSCMPKG